MAARHPLTNRVLTNARISPEKVFRVPATKRPRSPEPTENVASATKRMKATANSIVDKEKDKKQQQKREQRQEEERKWVEKYKRHFPTWTFYFDPNNTYNVTNKASLEAKILSLGAVRLSIFCSLESSFNVIIYYTDY
jgi:hypothetical protein